MRSRVVISFVLFAVLTVGCTSSEEPNPAPVAVAAIQRGALGFIDVDNSAVSPWCTAVLVAPDVVITAARCLDGVWAHQISFGVGAVTPDGAEGGLYPVNRIVLHPDRGEWQHGLAALILDAPVQNVAPADMAGGDPPADGPVESVSYRFVQRGQPSPRNFFAGAAQSADDGLTLVPTSGAPHCECIVGSGTMDSAGRLLGFVSLGTGAAAESAARYCAGAFKVATVAQNQLFVRQAMTMSAVPLVP